MRELHVNTEKVIEIDNGIEIHFAYNNELVGLEKSLFCISFKDISRKNVYFIIADNNFMNCSQATKKFLFYHECGHVINGDLEDRPIRRFLKKHIFRLYLYMEYKADKHAVRILGKDIAINAFQEITDMRKDTLYYPEIIHRYMRIKNGKC